MLRDNPQFVFKEDANTQFKHENRRNKHFIDGAARFSPFSYHKVNTLISGLPGGPTPENPRAFAELRFQSPTPTQEQYFFSEKLPLLPSQVAKD